jgi:pimeloyl-ACP methyl ester carboxylesterase
VSPLPHPGRRGLLVGVAAGAVAATGTGAVVAEHYLARRIRQRPDPCAGEPFGSLHSRGWTVLADDGVPLHVELAGDPDGWPTVVFVHGFALNMDSFHFQRRDLADTGARLVFYDQRSHGASGRGPARHSTLDQLGEDLAAVLDAAAPDAPVVLVGHSLGGMTIMALAERHPELFGSRVVAVALLATASGQLSHSLFGLPSVAGRLVTFAAPAVLPRLTRRAGLLEHGRRGSRDLSFLATKLFAFAGPAPPSLVRFVERMLARTSVEVMLEFVPTFLDHDRRPALATLSEVEVLVLTGDRDAMIPAGHSDTIADLLPHAELVRVPRAGHLVPLEHPDLVNDALRELIARVEPERPAGPPPAGPPRAGPDAAASA